MTAPSSDAHHPAQGFSIVGVGASAGGLEALLAMTQRLPADSGMAYVVLQHLGPDHPSHLVELLQRSSAATVHEAADLMALEENHVYVLPPDSYLTLEGETLRLLPRAGTPGPFLPVDTFFTSLAHAAGERAIGVVLSGTGYDGTAGVRSIKAAGGITFAQDGSAAYDGMPRSAIQTECVDFVLPPDLIATELVRFARSRVTEADVNSGFEELLDLLCRTTHVEFDKYKRSTILRRVKRRVLLHRLHSVQEYLAFVRDHPRELSALQDDLLIHVTQFFRDPLFFAALETAVLPALHLGRDADTTLRMWVPGCSTGEEVYSLAIAVLEHQRKHASASTSAPAVKIFGTDLSEQVLEKARRGHYPAHIERDVSPDLMGRYFVKAPAGYRVTNAVRDLCVFARHDLTGDPPFASLDVISCRNVLIYLGPALQRRVFATFHYGLRPGGFLLLGAAEAPDFTSGMFLPVDPVQKIYRRNVATRTLPRDYGIGRGLSGTRAAAGTLTAETTVVGDLQRQADHIVLERYASPAVVVDENLDIVHSRGDTSPYLALPSGTVTLNLLRMVRPGLLIDLRRLIDDARQSRRAVSCAGAMVSDVSRPRALQLHVVPLAQLQREFFLVVFVDGVAQTTPVIANLAGSDTTLGQVPGPDASASQIEYLRQEVSTVREHMQTVIDQLVIKNDELQMANEETLSSLEEVHSTNEELQAAEEELQATNEELKTLNEELQNRHREAARLSDDLKNLMQNTDLPVVIFDRGLRLRHFTPAAGAYFHLDVEDIGRTVLDEQARAFDPKFRELAGQRLAPGGAASFEKLDEAGHWVVYGFRPYQTADGSVDGVVLTVVNIDESKRSALRASREREAAESIISALNIPLAVIGDDLAVLTVNEAFCRDFQLSRGELEGRSLRDIPGFVPITPALNVCMHAALIDGEPFSDLEVRVPTAGAQTRIWLLSGVRLAQDDAEGSKLLLSIQDITARRVLEANLRQAQKLEAVGQLASGVAHDFNNQLMVINGYAELLKLQVKGDEQAERMLELIVDAAGIATSISKQLLAFSRRTDVSIGPVNLCTVLEEMNTVLRAALGARIELDVQGHPGAGWCVADATLLKQVIFNLVLNARDAMPDGGRLSMAIRPMSDDARAIADHPELEPRDYVVMSVQDSGVGIDASIIEHVFEPFFTTKEAGHGTGLGLATVYGTILQFGGKIFVTSRNGEGTRFDIFLRRADKVI